MNTKSRICLGRALATFGALTLAHPALAAHKRALLIGVHNYEHGPNSVFADLNTGSDVQVIRQTLIDKFGFAPADIVTLTSASQTTRQSIVDTFRKVLIDGVRPGDVLYFHYSGHGSQVADPKEPTGLDETIVPSDWETDGSKDIRDKELGSLISQAVAEHPSSFLLTFDSCHSGTITRGGRMMVRGVSYEKRYGRPAPNGVSTRGARMQLRGARMQLRGGVDPGYVVISACRDDQSAVETEDQNHQPIGRLSYLLASAMQDAGPDTTYRDLYEKIDADMLEQFPGQNPVVEGGEDTKLFNGTASPPQPYYTVYVNPSHDTVLRAGSLQGVTPGSQFALYKSGSKTFAPSSKIATATVDSVGLTESKLTVTGPHNFSGARAVEAVHQYGDNRLKVDTAQFAKLPGGQEVVDSLKTIGIIDTDLTAGDRPDVSVKQTGDGWDLISEDGGAVIGHAVAGNRMADQISDALRRQAKYRFARSLNNDSAMSPVRIEMRLVPAVVSGDDNMGVTWKSDKDPSAPGDTLRDGDYVTIEVRNVGNEDAYVSVLDLQSDATVAQLWPDPEHPITDNLIPHGNPNKWYKLWVDSPSTPWPFQLGKPYGAEIFKAIATREHVDFQMLRGKSTPATPLDELLKAAVAGTRAHAAVRPSAWATATVAFDVEAKQTAGGH